tara:strand:- start:137 stop:955 length:819 start_codon:yes stop_codon:yes gene_type:complete
MNNLFFTTKTETDYTINFPYKLVEKNDNQYFSMMEIKHYNSTSKYTPHKYILRVNGNGTYSKINTLKPVFAFTIRDDGTIIYVSKTEIRQVSLEGKDQLLYNNFDFLVDIKEDTEGNLIVLEQNTSLLKKISTNGTIQCITNGEDIILPNCFVIVEEGYLIGAKKYLWFVDHSGKKNRLLQSYQDKEHSVGYNNLLLRGNRIAFTYQSDSINTPTEICEYDAENKRFYYKMTTKKFNKYKKSDFLYGFYFTKKGKLIFWTDKGFSKAIKLLI